MARLSFTGIISLDGYVNDAEGNFDWAMPDEELHAFFNDLERPVGTHLYGRRLYETMVWWETMPPDSPIMDDYAALWRGADKIVFSSSLPDVSSARTTLVREFSPALVAELKATSARDISIGGPTLAAQVMDLVDDLHVVIFPVVVGGGTRLFQADVLVQFALVESRVFEGGVVYLHYRRA
jgi:dihydrofolate reductase